SDASFLVTAKARDPWQLDWATINSATTPTLHALAISVPQTGLQSTQPLHPAAVQHSTAYETRAKIHKYASYATLPLFAAELALGQSLFNSSTSSGGKKGVHSAVGAGIIGLFGVNTVTGAWNLFGEGWQEQDGRTLRLVHGLLMMAANGGFVATWALAPHGDSVRTSSTFDHDKRIHRNMAVASISVGTAGYLAMLLANHSPFARAQGGSGQGAPTNESQQPLGTAGT